jgi:hypothetical protein
VKRFLIGLLLAGLAFPALADLRRETEPNDPAAMAQPIVPPMSVGGTIVYASRGKWAELDATLAEAEKAVPDNLAPYYQAGRIIFLQGAD